MWLTVLWLLGSLAGAGVLGVVPATTAASTIALARARGDEGDSWRRFWREWRQGLVRANVAALPLVALGVMAGVNLAVGLRGGALAWTAPLSGVALLVVVAAGLWLGPLYAYYDLSPLRYGPAAVRLALFKPAPTAVMVLVAAAGAFGALKIPVLLALVVPGAWITALTTIGKSAFDHNEAALAQGTETRGEHLGLPREPLRIR